MIYLDTHVVVWLYAGMLDRLSEEATQHIQNQPLFISPMIILELQFLYEIKRISHLPEIIVKDLESRIGLTECNARLAEVVDVGKNYTWTRDPFDRLIVANAALRNARLISKDNIVREHYNLTVW